ncbi:Vegetative incompatibility HET-E-1 [Fusarium acutatum]|uniref:Vegetative incompatibility HET-E-1 n=1 Tax=Fusarium acutatum TaxID=78861 RepID=A0A8H4JZD6_9HYPO|nr:vegetative incompatibility HET-E-1 [Fusarium acutatum]KAF4441050.1 Vegetative incompatibility HET-E-1 [Fusarium acutatum]
MTDLTKLLSDSSVSAQQAAEKLASPCLEAIKKKEDASKIEGEFDGLWSSVLSAAEQTPHDKQEKLVETLHAIKSIPQSAETAKKVVVWGEEKRWDELPMFGGKAREQLDIAQEKSDEAFVNINGFFARATAAGVDDLSLFAIWTLREALEDPAADKISETSPKLLKASSVWFIYAADALAKASKDGKQFDGKVAKPGASLTEFKDKAGWRGFNNDRWKVWQDRFSTLKEADISQDSKSLPYAAARRSSAAMKFPLNHVDMALSLRDGARLKPDIRLAQAVSEFEAALSSEQKVAFRASRSSAANTAPTMSDVMRLTAEIDLKATAQHGRGRCFGPRMTNLLQAIQQFAALGDVVVGGSQNLIACGVWAAARMTVHVITGYFTYLEKLSFLFMTVGRNAPRYQAMAAIYPKSKNLQRYLCEYFIIVTRLCFQSISWTRKSAFSRLSTSISDPDMKEFQSELDIWSSSIKEEANLLLNQKIDEEAKENAKFRTLTTLLSESSSHQRRIKICARFLQACSQYDYRTTWKQTRKSGTTRLLGSFSEYQQWQSDQSSHDSILFRGKLGAGKSVLLANVVDDLNLQNNAIVLYFFARYDRHDGLNARTILGCLIRQLLEHFIANRDFDHIFQTNATIRDVDDVVEIFKQVPPHNQRVFIVIDGVDECPMLEQHAPLKALSIIQPYGYKLCVSVRALEQTLTWKDHTFRFNVPLPEDNPDISDYVQVEVTRRIQEGSLIIKDPNLIQEVKEELTNGACGMFLWASLQLDSICAEVTDHAIRQTIWNLPLDLTETFERNLAKASSGDTKGYHIRIFKLLASARELLTTEQLREAASVVVGRTAWDPADQIGRIEPLLRFCGSLVMVDEEDDTVRFIHHSARSFCLNTPTNTAAWRFSKDEAERSMAETLVTYLSYNVFDTRLTRNVVPKIEANDMPKKVALSTMKTSSVGKGITERFLKLRSQLRHDVGPVLAESVKSQWKDDSQQFFLLPYASKNWIFHTSHIHYLDPLCRWYSLLQHPTFGIDLTNIPRNFTFDSTAQLVPSTNMIWALSHGHMLLLKQELTKERGARMMRSYATLWIFLRHIAPEFINADMDYELVQWICGMLVQLRMKHPAKRHFLLRLSVFDEFYMQIVRQAIETFDIEAVTTLLSRDGLEQIALQSLSEALVELAISSGNLSLLNLLIREDFAVDFRANSATFYKVITSGMPEPLVARFVHCLLQGNIDLYSLSDSHFYLAIQLLNMIDSEQVLKLLERIPWRHSERRRRKIDLLLHKACVRGDLGMARMLTSIGCNPNTCTDEGSCLDVALYGISHDRLNLVWHLLESSALPSYTTLSRIVLLRQWAFVVYFLPLNISPIGSSSPILNFPFLAPSFEIVVKDMGEIEYPFLARIPEETLGIGAVTTLSQLPIVQSRSWDDWNFYFVTNYHRGDGWKPINDLEKKRLCEKIHRTFFMANSSKVETPGNLGDTSTVQRMPEIMEASIEFIHSHPDLSPWIKLTTPNTLSIIAEISRRWNWLSSMESGRELTHSWAADTTEKSLHAMWDEYGRLDSLGLWMLPKTIDAIEKRRYKYALVHNALTDAQWAVKELQQSYRLLHNLPSGYTLDVLEERLPVIHPPRFQQWDLSYFKVYSFRFAYMSVRIQWLRTLGLMSMRGLLAKVSIPTDLLLELGDTVMVLPSALEISEHDASASHAHGIMPSVLEAAFLGPESEHVLESLVERHPQWVNEVIAWIEEVDTGIFTWSMGQEAPLSFLRAFQSFRDIGTTERDMKLLEDALDMSRGRISELE